MNRSLNALIALVGLGGVVLAGCGGSSIAPYTGSAGTPRPGSPTPIPTATPTGTPTATPTGTPTPGNSGTLAAYFGVASDSRRLTYRDVTTTTTPNPVTGENTSETTTTTYTTGAGNPFSFGNAGSSTQVTLQTAQGAITVTRQEELDSGRVVGYTYYTLDSNAYTVYGSDSLDEQGRTSVRLRYNPGARFRLSLRVGETETQTVQVTQTTIDPDTNTTNQRVYTQTFTLKFVGIESVMTPAGTYANAARVNFDLAFNSPAQGESLAFSSTIATVSWYAPSVGMVKSTSDSRFTTQITGSQNYETRAISDVQLIAIASN